LIPGRTPESLAVADGGFAGNIRATPSAKCYQHLGKLPRWTGWQPVLPERQNSCAFSIQAFCFPNAAIFCLMLL